MNLFSKVFLSLIFAFSIVGCGGDNDDVADALERQNEILEEQNNTSSSSTTLHGNVRDLSSDAPADASIRVKIGNTWSEPVTTSNGEFELTGLATNSDYVLMIESPTDAFLDQVVFGITRASTDSVAFQDLGTIGVSEGVMRSISIINDETGEPISGLVLKGFTGNISVFEVNNFDEYAFEATFNESSGTYDIILPQLVSSYVVASLDTDRDGENDYRPRSSGFSSLLVNDLLHIGESSIEQGDQVVLQNLPITTDYTDVELRISVIDNEANHIPGMSLMIDDSINGEQVATYDEESGQYVFNVELNYSLEVMLPAFEVGETAYSSATLSISQSSKDGLISVRTRNTSIANSYTLPATTTEFDLVLQPKEVNPENSLEVLAKTREFGSDYQFKVFYSDSIDLPEDSAKLYQEDVISVTVGSESDEDLVLPGTTLIAVEDMELAITSSLSLNDTMLTLSPNTALEQGFDYRYQVDEIVEEYSEVSADVSGDYIEFSTTEVSGEFDINQLVLDNNNYLNNDEVMFPTNSAGVASNPRNWDESVSLYFPMTIHNLNTLSIVKRVVTDGTIVDNENQEYQIVVDGELQLSRFSKQYAYGLAGNENIDRTGSNVSTIHGTTLANGYWYRLSINERMSDHTAAEENSIVFEYVLERLNGEIESGTLDLMVN